MTASTEPRNNPGKLPLPQPFWGRGPGGGGRPRAVWLALLIAIPIYVAAWQIAEVDLGRLVTRYPKVEPFFRALLAPDFFDRERNDVTAQVDVKTPCPDVPPAVAAPAVDTPSVRVEPACAPLGATVAVSGAGFPASSAMTLTWLNPGGEATTVGEATTDAAGGFAAEITIPVDSIPEIYRNRVQAQRLVARAAGAPGGVVVSHNLGLILANIGVTIALGLLATLLGMLFAIPLSILGARNLMGANAASLAVYTVVRALMNVLRSIEPLIVAIVFVRWVSQGPFAGVLALTVHSIAALGKLYSEQIEAIDQGPIDAVRATGAGWLQTVVYAVIPQIVAPFTAFTIYRWDINVRMSTIIGFVGGGGIGYLLQQWIQLSQWEATATAVWVIAVVVMALDFLSAGARGRIAAGRPLYAPRWRPVVLVALALLAAWAWRTSEIDLGRLARDAGKVAPLAGELLRPSLVARGAITTTGQVAIDVPCDLAERSEAAMEAPPEPGSASASPSTSAAIAAPRLVVDVTCADAGDVIDVTGDGFPPGAVVALRWRLVDQGRLPAGRVRTDADGKLSAQVDVRPLVAEEGRASGAAVVLEAESTESAGGARLSPAVTMTLGALAQTLLMALLATTLGALLAIPFGFVAARNIMPPTRAGHAVYYAARTTLNVLRAIEPLILAAIFAAWVGYGIPFGGVLALVVVTVASLGKLFSEAVENIDPGPLEAIAATGASRLQTIVYGVVPQVIPPFLGFGIYHWDINVRISTVIGFVGGGGIGFVLREWMSKLQWSWASVAVIGIVAVVTAMDYASVRVRRGLG